MGPKGRAQTLKSKAREAGGVDIQCLLLENLCFPVGGAVHLVTHNRLAGRREVFTAEC